VVAPHAAVAEVMAAVEPDAAVAAEVAAAAVGPAAAVAFSLFLGHFAAPAPPQTLYQAARRALIQARQPTRQSR
jgi:hypothetical protein